MVQGYKFNVFYPDLIDRKVAPEFTVEKDPQADEFGSTCVLRFHAGPPYEVSVCMTIQDLPILSTYNSDQTEWIAAAM